MGKQRQEQQQKQNETKKNKLVVHWLVVLPHSMKVLGSILGAPSLPVLPVLVTSFKLCYVGNVMLHGQTY